MNWPDDYINKIICGDCLEVMRGIPDGVVDSFIADPPYGINIRCDMKTAGRGNMAAARDYKQVHGDDRPFDPRPLLRRFYERPMVLFGANYFAELLPSSSAWRIWDKRNGVKSDDNADCELIWTNDKGPARLFRYLWKGCIRAGEKDSQRVHPTQKPIALMRWLIDLHSKPDDLILDPFAGSGTTLVAAKQLGRRYIGIEIIPKYCRDAEDRLRQEELF